MNSIRRSILLSTIAGALAVPLSMPLAVAQSQSADVPSGILEQVTVTARKRDETLLDVPMSITSFSSESLERLNIQSFNDYALKTPNLSFAEGTSGRGFGSSRSIAIRGISGSNTVGVYIDDTPVPEQLDPRVVDIERIEVLKGPQGTLFGQGSLGGTLRIVTVRPSGSDPNAYVQARVGATKGASDPDYGVSFAGSHPLVEDKLTARLVGYYDEKAAFLKRSFPGADGERITVDGEGGERSYGGSISMLWNITEKFSALARVMYQKTEYEGWVAPFAPLPDFEIKSMTLDRMVDIQENSSDRWYLPSLTLNYESEGYTVTSSTSYFDRITRMLEDSTEGTQWAHANVSYLYPVPVDTPMPVWAWDWERGITNETRVSFEIGRGFSAIVGVYYNERNGNNFIDSRDVPGILEGGFTSFEGYCGDFPVPCPSYGTGLSWYSEYPSQQTDRAAFGELYLDWNDWQFTAGLRAYEQKRTGSVINMGAYNAGYTAYDLAPFKESDLTPKVSASYKFDQTTMVYASVAKGFRSGGNSQVLPAFCERLPELGVEPGRPNRYESDTVWNYEIGGKMEMAGGRMIVSGALFQMDWEDIQQSYTVPICFLGIRVNQGAARARGGEIEIAARPLDSLELTLGVGYDDAKITEQGLISTLPPPGSRVEIVPKVTANMSATYTKMLGNFEGFISSDVSHVGDSISNTARLRTPLVRDEYTILNARVGVRWDRSEITLYASNITDERPNLGDLGSSGYIWRESQARDAQILPRVVTLRPFNAGLQFRQRF